MENIYSDFNLKIKNLFIGLCRGSAGLPSALRNLGYKIDGIEFKFQNSKGNTVKPELIFSSDTLENTVMLESKKGGNIDEDQYKKYLEVTSEDLRERAYLGPKCVKSIDITYVVPEVVIDKSRQAFQNLNFTTPLLCVSLDKILLNLNKFSKQELTELFEKGILVDYNKIPYHFIPFDRDSSKWIVAEKIMPIILQFVFENRSYFTSKDILEKVFQQWSSLDAEEQKEMERKVLEVIQEAASWEFKEFLHKNREIAQRTHVDTWSILKNPLKIKPSKRVKAWKKLAELQAALIERLRTGKKQPLQLELDF